MTRFAAAILLALATTAGAVAQTPMSKELTSLQGTWVITAANGQEPPPGSPEVAFVVKDDKYTQTVDGSVVERGGIRIDATKKPMAIDLIIVEGDDANKTQLGVIQILDNTILVKLNTPALTVRPTDFAPADGFFVFSAKKK